MMIFAINRLMCFVPEQSKRASAWCEHTIGCRVGSLVSLKPVEDLKTGQLLKLFSNEKFPRKKKNTLRGKEGRHRYRRFQALFICIFMPQMT